MRAHARAWTRDPHQGKAPLYDVTSRGGAKLLGNPEDASQREGNIVLLLLVVVVVA